MSKDKQVLPEHGSGIQTAVSGYPCHTQAVSQVVLVFILCLPKPLQVASHCLKIMFPLAAITSGPKVLSASPPLRWQASWVTFFGMSLRDGLCL